MAEPLQLSSCCAAVGLLSGYLSLCLALLTAVSSCSGASRCRKRCLAPRQKKRAGLTSSVELYGPQAVLFGQAFDEVSALKQMKRLTCQFSA